MTLMTLYGPRQLADGMRTVRRNTIRIADDIPATRYDFRPTPESRSAAELLVHIAWLASADRFLHEEERIDAIADVDFGALLAKSNVEERRTRSKDEIIELLTAEGDRQARWVDQLIGVVPHFTRDLLPSQDA